MYNKSHIIGPLWYRQLMREVIVAVGLGVDDLAFDQVEDRYFAEALPRAFGRYGSGTHPARRARAPRAGRRGRLSAGGAPGVWTTPRTPSMMGDLF